MRATKKTARKRTVPKRRNPSELVSSFTSGLGFGVGGALAAGAVAPIVVRYAKRGLKAISNPAGFTIGLVPRKGEMLRLPRVFPTKAAATAQARKIRRIPKGTKKVVLPMGYRNPEKAAAAATAGFHGAPAGDVIEIVTEEHFHEWLADLGELVSLEVMLPEGNNVLPLEHFDGARLAMNEERTQLFIRGGDQEVPLDVLERFGVDLATLHEREVVGPVAAVTYYTTKHHLGEQGGTNPFRHLFGEDGGSLPILIYRVRDALLEFAGGSYTIPDEGIVN